MRVFWALVVSIAIATPLLLDIWCSSGGTRVGECEKILLSLLTLTIICPLYGVGAVTVSCRLLQAIKKRSLLELAPTSSRDPGMLLTPHNSSTGKGIVTFQSGLLLACCLLIIAGLLIPFRLLL